MRRLANCFGFIATVSTSAVLLLPTPLLANSAAHYRQMGLSYREQGRLSDAIAAFQEAVEREPQNLSGRITLGWTLHLAKQDRKAAAILQQTASLDPFHTETFNALGIIYLTNDDLAAAVLTHTWSRLLEPDNEIAYYNLSLAYHRLKHYDRAIASATTAFELEPDNPHPLVALAIAHWDSGNTTAAQQVYQQTVDLDARYANPSFLSHLDQAGFSSDQIDVSQRVLQAWLALRSR